MWILTLIESLKKVNWHLIYGAVIIALLCYIKIMQDDKTICEANLKSSSVMAQIQNQAIIKEANLEIEQHKKMDEAKAEAVNARMTSEKEAQALLMANVPKECNGAIKWAVDVAKDI